MGIKILLALLAVLFFASFAFSANWYVSKSGNNSTGSSWANAWTDLDQIKWASVNAGDTVFIDGGASSMNYNGMLTVGKAGTAAQRITIQRSEEAGHNGHVYWYDGVDVDYPYITIDGKNRDLFEIMPNGKGRIIQVLGGGDYFELKNTYIRGDLSANGGDLLVIFSNHALVKSDGFYGANARGEDHIKFLPPSSNGTITIEDSIFSGLSQYNGGHCSPSTYHCDVLQTWTEGVNIIARRNIFKDVLDIFMIYTGEGIPLGDLEFSYNVFSNGGDAIKFTSARSLKVYNNVFDGSYDLVIYEPMSNITVKNNIYTGTSWRGLVHQPSPGGNSLATQYSLWDYGTTSWEDGTGNIQASSGQQIFVNKAAGDYHLAAGSPAINKGTNLGFTSDIEGKPIVGTPDIGPFEFQGNAYYIRAGSSCSSNCGNDWTNAFPSFSAANSAGVNGKLTRGATYYLASGTYDSSFTFDTPTSGTQVITIRKATQQNSGSIAGWLASFGTGQAVFTQLPLTFNTDYFVLDGVMGGGPASWKSGHGFKILMPEYTSTFPSENGILLKTNGNISILHTEFVQLGNNVVDTTALGSSSCILGTQGPLTNNLYFGYNYFHHITGSAFYPAWGNNVNTLFEYNYFEDICGMSTANFNNHCEYLAPRGYDGLVVRYNFFRDGKSSGTIVNNAGGTSLINSDFYGNIFYNNLASPIVDNMGSLSNVRIFNNDFVLGKVMSFFYGTSGIRLYNNIADSADHIYGFGFDHDYGIYTNPPTCSSCSQTTVGYGPHENGINHMPNYDDAIISTYSDGSPIGTPFVDAAGGNFNLLGPIKSWVNSGNTISGAGYNVCNLSGVTCDSTHTYNIDMFGNVRGQDGVWDRGAIEFTGGSPPPSDTNAPSVPANLSATAVSSSQINLSWTASTDNVSVTGYNVYRGASKVGTSTITSYPDTGLAPSTTYNYNVSAFDAASNESAQSSQASATTPAGPAPGSGLVLALGFNEGSGTTTADVSGNNNNGTLTNATWSTSGKFASALSFNGTSSWVTVADSASLDLTSAVTIEAWVYPTSVTGWRSIAMKELDALYYLYASSLVNGAPVNTPALGLNIGGYRELTASSPLTASAWVHVAGTYDGSMQRLFVNGTQVASRSQTGSLQTSSNPLRIGGNSKWGEYFQGRIDEVRVYNRALTQAEIQSDMITEIGSSPPPRTCFDLTSDGKVDVFDLVFVSLRLGNPVGDAADIIGNDGVNLQDLQEVAKQFGQKC